MTSSLCFTAAAVAFLSTPGSKEAGEATETCDASEHGPAEYRAVCEATGGYGYTDSALSVQGYAALGVHAVAQTRLCVCLALFTLYGCLCATRRPLPWGLLAAR